MQNDSIPLRESFRYWLKLGFISFGGPTGQIAMMHKDLVEKKKWIAEDHFLQALNFCMLLPGPEAQQLATYIGWLLNGRWGGVIAGGLFVLPSIFILWLFAWLYASLGSVPSVAALFYGLKPAVVAIVLEAVLRIGKKSLKTGFLYSLAAAAFVGIYVFNFPFPVIVLSAGLIGYFSGTLAPGFFPKVTGNKSSYQPDSLVAEKAVENRSKGWQRFIKVLAVFIVFWSLPIILLGLWRGWNDTFIDIGILFSKAAVVTFGGAYAVLGYVSQQAVSHYQWIMPEQMMDGLGLAETTPGPLIMVNQFVGYLAGYYHAQGLSPALGGAIGGLLTTWVTFIPSFMMIFLLAPYIETLRKNRKLGTALSAITASVVGVVLNLAVIFTYHTLVPDAGGFDWYALVASIVAFVGMQRLKWGMVPVIAGSAVAGYVWQILI
ncbi:MAG: chromate efflux transporter [Nitrospirae bacterium]|nr:chromate efflux transporter [Nitrospirota bacterium]NTW66368.1 chromate efflux transporter [Nitrospirota bacterium]